ncbi:cation:proton antiporter [Candidatus Bathyarchaeota archaeon]|nr:cation:proton antiporter [Candidatus Bathyarchaeota archaeon]
MEQQLLFRAVVDICLLIALAEVASAVSAKLRLPRIIGTLSIGILFGPKMLGGLQLAGRSLIEFNELVYVFAELGAVLLLFGAGLHMTFGELKRSGAISFTVALAGVIVPYVMGFVATVLLGYDWYIAMIIGGSMAATSIAISVKSLDEMGRMSSTEAKIILGAAIIDDVLALSLASVIFTIVVSHAQISTLDIILSLSKTLGVWFVLTAVSARVVPTLLDYVTRLKVGDGHLIEAFSILVCFSYAAFSGTLGLSPLVGAFIAGMAIADSLYLDLIKDFLEKLGVIFVPLFFVVMGASVDPHSILHGNFLLIFILCLVGVVSKLIGCGLPAAYLLKDRTCGMRIGYGMISRGEIGLVIASMGATYGILPGEVYTALILMIFVTSLLPPFLLKRSYLMEAKTLEVVARD